MSPIKILEDALAEGRSFADLAGKLRDKFKSGTADLQAIYDEAEGVVDGAIAKARDGLAAFKSEVAKVESDVKGAEDGTTGTATLGELGTASGGAGAPTTLSAAVQAVVADTGAPAEHVEPAVQAHVDAVEAGQTAEVAQASAQAAAAGAGASPEVAVAIAESVATQPAADAPIPTTVG